MKKLNNSTIKIIGSSYTISSIELVVKELVENSLDSGASRIIINMTKYGLEKIDVIDNGCGISDATEICKHHSTSKLTDFADICNVKTFGFRGQVLASLCCVSNVSVTSNSKLNSSLGSMWAFNQNGEVIAENKVACKKGTTISVSNLFYNLPVRRQVYKSLYELQKAHSSIVRYVKQLYLSRRNVHIKLCNDGKIDLNLPISDTLDNAVRNVITADKYNMLELVEWNEEFNANNSLNFTFYLPNKHKELWNMSHTEYKDVCFLFINNRPVDVVQIFKSVRHEYQHFANDKRLKYPLCFMFIEIPSHWVDVNIDPDKRKVSVSNLSNILESIELKLSRFFMCLAKLSDRIVENAEVPYKDDVNNNNNSDIIKYNQDKDVNNNTTSNTYIPPMYPNQLEDVSLFSSPDNSYLNMTDNSDNARTFEFDSTKYAMGKLDSIKGDPVKNVNLKRSHENISDSVSKKRKYMEDSSDKHKASDYTRNGLCVTVSIPKPIKGDNQKPQLIVVNCWKEFIIISQSEFNEGNNLNVMIVRKLDLLICSTYIDRICEMQIPSETMNKSIPIEDYCQSMIQHLDQLPQQLINNVVSGKKFMVISCPHLLKNGFRIHAINNESSGQYEIITKPSFIAHDDVKGQIDYILQNRFILTDGSILRPPIIEKWIRNSSTAIGDQEVKLKSNDQEFWKLQYLRISKFPDSMKNLLTPLLEYKQKSA